MTPTGQAIPETAGRERPTHQLLLIAAIVAESRRLFDKEHCDGFGNVVTEVLEPMFARAQRASNYCPLR